MRRMPLRALLIGILGAAFTAGLVTAAPRARHFFSARHGVGVETPVGWSLSRHTGYPDVLAVLVHPSGGRMSLSAAPTAAATAQALAQESRRGMEAQHLTIARVGAGARGGVEVQATNAARGETLRQLYIVRPFGEKTSPGEKSPSAARQGIVLTLVARDAEFAALTPAFDWAAAHLALETPSGAPEPAPDAGAAPSAP